MPGQVFFSAFLVFAAGLGVIWSTAMRFGRLAMTLRFFAFAVGAFAVALGSCMAKYVRETAMDAFNAYFEELQAIISNHLEDLEHNRLPAIARATGYSIEVIQQAIEELRKLSLNPGADFNDVPAPPVTPDIFVELTLTNRTAITTTQNIARKIQSSIAMTSNYCTLWRYLITKSSAIIPARRLLSTSIPPTIRIWPAPTKDKKSASGLSATTPIM